MKFLLVAAILSCSSALACPPSGTPLKQGALAIYSAAPQFKACLKKLSKKGVDVEKASAWRYNRPENETGPVIYTVTVQGKGSNGRQWRLSINYDLPSHSYKCGKATDILPRCF